jgi:adenosine deaminase
MISYPDYLRLLPKVELHCHFVATIRPSTLIELAHGYGIELPSTDPDQLFDYDNIVDFLSVFRAANRVFQQADDFARVAYEGVSDAVAAGNLRYREYFVNAASFPGLDYSEVIDAITTGLTRAEVDFGVGFGLIPAVHRGESPERAVQLVRRMIEDPRPGVVGLGQDDLTAAATESPELWKAAYDLAARHGINRTAHVAEIPNSSAGNVTIAVDDLGCTRIDHGYHIMHDADVVAMARDRQIPFTCTPFSTTVLSGWALGPEHPIAAMIRAGLNVTFSTDDPTFFRTDIGQEYVVALPAMGFGPDVAKRIALAGVEAAWCPPAQKDRLRAEFTSQFLALDALLEPQPG